MIRSVASKPMFLAVSMLLASAMTVGCNSSKGSKSKYEGDVGSARFNLVVNGAIIDTIHYQIDDLSHPPPAGPAAVSGDVSVPGNGPSASFLVSGFQPDHYKVDLSATAHT